MRGPGNYFLRKRQRGPLPAAKVPELPADGPLKLEGPMAAQMWLTPLLGKDRAWYFIVALESWGPKICSDGWHADNYYGEVILRKCDCTAPGN